MNTNRGVWSVDEHDRFLQAIQIYPHGPWRFVAKHVATRVVRQVQTHAQKYYEKIGRHLRGLHKERRAVIRTEHRIDGFLLPLPYPLAPVEAGHRPDPVPNTHSACRQDATATIPSSFSVAYGHLADDEEPLPLFDANAELPSLEESLDILLQCLSDF